MFSNTLVPINSFENIIRSLVIKFTPRFMTYSPKHRIKLETSNYILKTANSSDELNEVFKLRHRNFLEGVENNTQTHDIDQFDHICDHLIIKDKSNNEIIGTYRVMCSLYTNEFYSQGEFNLTKFLKEDGVKLELGRACIDPSHRNGNVIDLLWRGIAKYAEQTNARFLFGCSSVHTVEAQMAASITKYLVNKDKITNCYDISPTDSYKIDYSGCINESIFNVKSMIPPLLLSYLTAGAKVHGLPAIDKEFECIDYMTILDLENISPLFQRRYFKWLTIN